MLSCHLLLQVFQKEREEKLAEILKNRLHQYVQRDKDGFISHAEAEVARLSNAGNFLNCAIVLVILYVCLFYAIKSEVFEEPCYLVLI